ncbi:BPTD_2524 family lipoprotein [Bordetella petrii]|uniref:BPTD_2524 family lipoprotein n=1 Tax=Bordetella petrii TaxID=94624 RepID=UPI003734A3BC
MIRIAVAAAACAVGLAGCSSGISAGGNSPTDSFTAQSDYREAYRAANAQAERCLRGSGAYQVVGGLDQAGGGASLRVVAPFTGADVARVRIAALNERQSKVDITMWGRGIWNSDAVRAMREAIIYGVPSCVSYMPGDPRPSEEAWTLPQPR